MAPASIIITEREELQLTDFSNCRAIISKQGRPEVWHKRGHFLDLEPFLQLFDFFMGITGRYRKSKNEYVFGDATRESLKPLARQLMLTCKAFYVPSSSQAGDLNAREAVDDLLRFLYEKARTREAEWFERSGRPCHWSE